MHVGLIPYAQLVNYWSLEVEGERRIVSVINKIAYWLTKNVYGDDP